MCSCKLLTLNNSFLFHFKLKFHKKICDFKPHIKVTKYTIVNLRLLCERGGLQREQTTLGYSPQKRNAGTV